MLFHTQLHFTHFYNIRGVRTNRGVRDDMSVVCACICVCQRDVTKLDRAPSELEACGAQNEQRLTLPDGNHSSRRCQLCGCDDVWVTFQRVSCTSRARICRRRRQNMRAIRLIMWMGDVRTARGASQRSRHGAHAERRWCETHSQNFVAFQMTWRGIWLCECGHFIIPC